MIMMPYLVLDIAAAHRSGRLLAPHRHREQEWLHLWDAACGPPAAVA